MNPEDRDFNSVATKVKSSKAKAVYYGGEYPAGAPLSQQIKDSVKIPFMGGDGMYSADFISLNKKAEGDIATSVGKPVEELESAKKFIADYKTAKLQGRLRGLRRRHLRRHLVHHRGRQDRRRRERRQDPR